MSEAEEYSLEDLGGGRFAISGVFGFSTAAEILAESITLFEEHSVIDVDLAGVTRSDSAGLALLLEWVNWAKYYVREITYRNLPAQMQAIAEISEVGDMLAAGQRWTRQGPR